jgi:2-polyprenyl-3-methyl-5-hydroxy-6-metoxy-1,4-benzoquinol methylase
MNESLVDHLRCPTSGERLTCLPYKTFGSNVVIDGVLRSPRGGVYAVQQGVPQLVPELAANTEFIRAYAKALKTDAPALLASRGRGEFSFSYQWDLHSYDQLTWELTIPERLEIFQRYFGPIETLRGQRLLDAGCGNGTLSAALAERGLEVFAMDYSTSVYRAFATRLVDSAMSRDGLARLQYVQGDVQRAPFADGYFDVVYSDGVLHHTPDTRTSFMALARKVKAGGQFFVWLYRKDCGRRARLKLDVVNLGRKTLRPLSHDKKLALAYVGAAILLTRVRLLRLLGNRRRRVIPLRLKALNLFDTFSPQFNHEHTPTEVTRWFQEAEFREIRDVSFSDYRFNEEGFGLIGTR